MKDKKAKKETKIVLLNTRNKKIAGGIIAAVLIIFISVIMVIESMEKCQLVVKNNSNLNLEYVKAGFVQNDMAVAPKLKIDKLQSKNSIATDMKPVNLLGMEANYKITFKLEGYPEMYVIAGEFGELFKGEVKVTLDNTNNANLLKLTVKANNGLLPSKLIKCNDVFTVDLKKGYAYGE